MPLAKDTEAEIVITPPWLLRIFGWILLLLAIGIFILGFTDPADELPSLFWSIVLGLGLGTVCILFGLFAISMATSITFNQAAPGMTVRWRYWPFVARTKKISKAEIGSVAVHPVQRTVYSQHGDSQTWTVYQVTVVLTSGKRLRLLEDRDRGVADHLTARIRGL